MTKERISSLCCIFVLLAGLTVLQPYLQAGQRFWKNSPKTYVLDSGLTLVYHFDDSSATTVFHILFMGGAKAQPQDKQGLAFMTTRLMLEVPDRNKFQDLMRVTPHYSMLGKMDYSRINFSCLSEHLDEALGIIADIIQDPLFSSTRINKVKEEMKYRRLREEDDPVIVGHRAMVEELVGDSGYGDAVLGTDVSRKGIKRRDILRFYEQHVRAGNMMMIVSTDLTMERIRELIETSFAKIPASPARREEPILFSLPDKKEIHIEKQTTQSLVSLGFSLPVLTPRNFALAFLIEILLGKGVNSRLWDLRAVENLCYNMNCRVTYLNDGGILEAYLETDTERREKALSALRNIFTGLLAEGLDEEELLSTKTYAQSYLMRGMEAKELRVQNMGYFAVTGVGHHVFEEMEAVTLDEINRFIQEHLDPQRAVQVTVGPSPSSDEAR